MLHGDGTFISSKQAKSNTRYRRELKFLLYCLTIGAVAVAVLLYFLRLPTPKSKLSEKLKRVDYIGTVIVLAFSTLFLLALNFGGQTFPWKSAAVIVPLVLSVLLVGLLTVIEKRFAKEPLMPPRLFRNRSVVSVLFVNWFYGMSFFAAVYYLPVYFQVVRNDSAMWSGIRLIPMQLVLCFISTLAGLTISKTGVYRPMICIGMGLMTLWIGLTTLYDQTTPFSRKLTLYILKKTYFCLLEIYGITILGSGSLGCLFSSTIIALQASVEIKDIAVVTGLGNFSRILGGALGVGKSAETLLYSLSPFYSMIILAISSAVLNSHLNQELPNLLPIDEATKVIQSSEYVNHGLPEEYKVLAIEVYVHGLQMIWYVLIAMSGLGFIASFFVKHHSVRRHVKAAAAAKQENEADKVDSVVVEIASSIEEEIKDGSVLSKTEHKVNHSSPE